MLRNHLFKLSSASVLFVFALLLLPGIVCSEIPQIINYQGHLTDAAGVPLNDIYDMAFAIYDVAENGTPVWQETHADVQVSNGLFSVRLGSIDPTGNPLTEAVFDESSRWLGITVGEGTEMSRRTQFTSVPYAFSDDDWTKDGDNIYRMDGDVGIGTPTPDEKLTVDGNAHITGDLTVDGNISPSVSGSGSVFTRWGNGEAPLGTSLLYSGFAYASGYTTASSLTPIVIDNGDPDVIPTTGDVGHFYPLAIGPEPTFPSGNPAWRYIKGAVCYADSPVFIKWGSHNPPSGWSIIYRGYALSNSYSTSGTIGPICVDWENFDNSVDAYESQAVFIGGIQTVVTAPGDEALLQKWVRCAVCKKQ
jgi:hypothetical protein